MVVGRLLLYMFFGRMRLERLYMTKRQTKEFNGWIYTRSNELLLVTGQSRVKPSSSVLIASTKME